MRTPENNRVVITGYSLESACATGNHCIAESAKIIQRGDADVILAGGVEIPLLEPIIYGFGNMNTILKVKEGDHAFNNPKKISALQHRPEWFYPL